jgi:hypothetical protein
VRTAAIAHNNPVIRSIRLGWGASGKLFIREPQRILQLVGQRLPHLHDKPVSLMLSMSELSDLCVTKTLSGLYQNI